MGLPRVAIIVLNYRGETILPACLASAFEAVSQDDAVIVVDNGGESALMAREKAKHPSLQVVTPEKNLGFAAGMNTGLRHALQDSFDAFWLMNNDAVITEGALDALKQAMVERGAVNLFSPLIRTKEGAVWFSGGAINFWRMRSEHETQSGHKDIYTTSFLTGCALFIPRSALEKLGFLDERYFLYYEDAEYSLRASRHSIPLLMVPQSVVLHQEVSRGNPEKTYWLVRSGTEFFLRESPLGWRLWVFGFLLLRRAKNILECFLRPSPIARSVRKAYTDASPYA